MSVALSMPNSSDSILHSASNISLPTCEANINVQSQNGRLESTNTQEISGPDSVTTDDSNTTNQTSRKRLTRGKSTSYDDTCEKQEFVHDESVFPSPFAITQEEALKETYPLLARQNNRYHLVPPNGGNDESGDTTKQNINNESPEHSYDGQNHVLTPRPSIRRESDKPPRLQKQASKDRLTPSSGRLSHTHSFDSNGGESNGSLSKHSSTECLDSMGVDVHEFLVKALQGNSRDRSILLKLEHDMMQFVNNPDIGFMKFPEMTSYHRMLVHRVAAYFGLDHNIDAKGKSVIINKTPYTRMPEKKFSDYAYDVELCNARDEDMRRRSILKRMKNCQSFEHFKPEPHKSWKTLKQRSFEEREVNYEKIRARIFNEDELNEQGGDKSRVRELWTKKQWESSDQMSLRDNSASPLPQSENAASSPKPKPGPGITVLSRRNNPEFNGNTSPSSSTSSTNQFVANEMSSEQHTSGNLHQYTPYQDASNLTLPSSGHVVNLKQTQLIIAVPIGFTVEPGTVLTHPRTGAPYVTVDGQPILYPSKPVMVPTYPTPPFPVHMGYQPLHRSTKFYPAPYQAHRPPYANNHCFVRQDSRDNSVQRNGYPNVQQIDESSDGNFSQPQYYPPTYQPAPVQLVYYPSSTAVQVVSVPANNPVVSTASNKEELGSKMNDLNIDEPENNDVIEKCKDDGDDGEVGSGNEVTLAPTDNLVPMENKMNVSGESADTQDPTAEHDTDAAQQAGSEDAIQAELPANTAANNGSTIPTVQSGASYYTYPPNVVTHSHHPPGAQGITPANPPQAYGQMGVGAEINPQLHQRPTYYIPGYPTNPMYNYGAATAQPVYYVMGPNGLQPFQVVSNQQLHYNNMVYPQYNQDALQQTSYPGPASHQYSYNGEPASNNNAPAFQNDIGSGGPVSECHPLLVQGDDVVITSPELNTFAAKHNAKIAQVQLGEVDTTNSIYLVFHSSDDISRAMEELKFRNQKFKLSEIVDPEARNEVVAQIRTVQ